MNRLITGLAVAAATATTSSTAMAQAYAGAAGGQSTIAVECAGFSYCQQNGHAYRYVAGHRFSAGIAAEFGISDFGSAKLAFGNFTATTSVTAYTLGVAFDAPLGPWAGLTSRAGVARLKTEVSAPGFYGNDTANAPYAGVGLYVAPWQNTRIELGFDMSRAEFNGDKGDVRAVLLGVRTQF